VRATVLDRNICRAELNDTCKARTIRRPTAGRTRRNLAATAFRVLTGSVNETLTGSSSPRCCDFLALKRGGKWPSRRHGCGKVAELRPYRTARVMFFNCDVSGLPMWRKSRELWFQNAHAGRTRPPVIAGRDLAIHEAAQREQQCWLTSGSASWMRGSSPRMTPCWWRSLLSYLNSLSKNANGFCASRRSTRRRISWFALSVERSRLGSCGGATSATRRSSLCRIEWMRASKP